MYRPRRKRLSLRPKRNLSPSKQGLCLALGFGLFGLGLWTEPSHPIGTLAFAVCWLPLLAGFLGWAPWLELLRLRHSHGQKNRGVTIFRGRK